ncbi:class I SAM-dependent methyltransferase [Nitriliruptor alkaliphilus]|uniref:class I SAM-dependent methyltransferase n=1 Tax=Nitriliruptor alkaliphilus TaxID=427918 RepID=UPI000695BCB3|nr:class I SAM-dependent methyltransferase [Nitriliruptor alkaliphilus]
MPVYLALPAEPTFTPVLERVPASASVLDLGCGVGRLANLLVQRGHEVAAVDESDAMLAHVDRRVRSVRSRIEELDLDRGFDAVVLASHLVNVPDRATRRALLATVRRHLVADGEAFLQHHDASSDRYEVGTNSQRLATAAGDLELTTTIHERRDTWLRATTTMTLDGVSWSQHYETELLSPDALTTELEAARLRAVATPTSTWTIARPTE